MRSSTVDTVAIRRSLPVLFAFFVLLSPLAFAETVRVAGWNLQGIADETLLKQAAESLKNADPGVILLQGVQDWQRCDQLAESLKPKQYYVLICSSFPRSATNGASSGQVAVLSKTKAYFSWSEPWSAPGARGGFAFAAIQVAGQRLGFFSVALGPPPAAVAEAASRQLLEQADAIRQWEANRVQSFVAGLSLEAPTHPQQSEIAKMAVQLQEAGFSDARGALATDERPTFRTAGQPGAVCDFLLVQPNVFPIVQKNAFAVMGRYPVVCDLELDPAKVAAGWTARAQELQLRSSAERQVSGAVQQGASRAHISAAEAPVEPPRWWWLIGGAMAASLIFLLWFLAKSAKRTAPRGPRLLTAHSSSNVAPVSSFTVVVTAPAGEKLEQAPPPELQLCSPTIQTQPPEPEHSPARPEAPGADALAIDREQLTASLSAWLKQKFVRKLVRDRAELLQAQQAAALTAMQVDERLTKVEKQIREQTRNYEQRLEELSDELVAAREENRALIRERIAQVKLEMEAVRARMRTAAEKR